MDSLGDTISLNTDEILPYVTDFGRFQWILEVIMFLIFIPAAFQAFIMYFSTITPSWKCRSNITSCLLNGTFPGDDLRRCYIPRADWYYTEHKHFSLVTQFDIHCTDRWQLHLLSSIFFVGWGCGAPILGWMGDRYGRKVTLFSSFAIVLLLGFVSAFLKNIYCIIAIRLIIGFFFPGITIQALTLLSELVGSKHRPLAVTIPLMAPPLAWGALAMQGYLLKNWKLLTIICTAPYIFIIISYSFVPESVRWFQLNGRVDEAMRVFNKIARWNKRELPSNIVLSSARMTSHRSNVIDIFRTRAIAFQSALQCYLWFVVALCTYGLAFAANDFEGSVYRDFAILSLMELPGAICGGIFCNRFGRKKASLIPLLMSGVASIGVAFVPATGNLKVAKILIGIVGKYFASTAFCSFYIWSAEIFPTDVRSAGMGVLQVFARIGSAGAPWVVKVLRPFGMCVPFLVMGVPVLIASFVGMWLPETKGTILKEHFNEKQPDTVSGKQEDITLNDRTNLEQHDTAGVTQTAGVMQATH